jgi:CheY-like chemotaxis protein
MGAMTTPVRVLLAFDPTRVPESPAAVARRTQAHLLSLDELLRRAGCEVRVAETVEEHHVAFASGSYDAAIIDGHHVVSLRDPSPRAHLRHGARGSVRRWRDLIPAIEGVTGRTLRSPFARPSVAFVDDEAPVAALADRVLERAGLLGRVFTTHDDLLAACADTVFDVVFVHRKAGSMTGIEAAAAVRALPGYANVRIGFTGAERGDPEAVLASGIDFYLRKPYSPESLLGFVLAGT